MKTITRKMMMAALIAVGLAACARQRHVPVTPAQRGQAVTIVANGGTVADVAVELGLSIDDARWVVRSTARDLLKWLPSSYGAEAEREPAPEAEREPAPEAEREPPIIASACERARIAR